MSVVGKSVQRIIKKDIPSCTNDDMKSNGIYYFANDATVMKGLALIIGPPGTPYHGGFWFFAVDFPDDYPHSPPHVVTLTQDGITRFNPNMYVNGKVCLSLLGTWHQGDKWSAVQTVGSVLLSILGMVLTEEPLRNEPCYSTFTTHPTFNPYNRLVFHASVETLLRFLDTLPEFIPAEHKEDIAQIMRDSFSKTREALESRCRELAIQWDGKVEENNMFRMSKKYRFAELADRIHKFAS